MRGGATDYYKIPDDHAVELDGYIRVKFYRSHSPLIGIFYA